MTEPATQQPEAADLQAAAADRTRALRETLLICAVCALAVGAGIAGLWFTSYSAIRDNYQHYLVGIAGAAAAQIDPILHDSIRDPAQINGEAYLHAVEPLRRLRLAVRDVKYAYTVVRDGADVRFVLDSAAPGDLDRDGVEDQSGVWERYEHPDPAMLESLGSERALGAAVATDRPYSDDWGVFMTGYAPILDDRGRQVGSVGVDVDASVYLARIARTRDWALLGVAPAALVIVALGFMFYHVRRRGLAAGRAVVDAAEKANQAAQVLAVEQERLRESEHKFRSLFELSPVGIALNDFNTGRFLQVNDALVAPSGYTREELLERSYWDLTPKTYAPLEQKQLESLATTNRYGPFEKEYVRKDGTRYPVLLAGMRMTDVTGRPVIWSIIQDISLRKVMESKLTEAARRDKLTGLANRALFMERLQATLQRLRDETQKRFAVLFLDCDRFKLVNDTLGHDAGDELLRQIAGRLQRSLRAADAMSDDVGGNLIARFGGDEFVVLVNDLKATADAVKVAERLLNALTPAYTIKGRDIHATASIGIVTSAESVDSPEEVMRNADVAMYEAKRSGRGRALVFNDAMHTRLARMVSIESGLREAIGTPQLWLAYQPIVDLASGQMMSAEALVRWTHPVLGALRPDEFVPIAEDSGLIVPLGDWVLVEACRQLSEWRAKSPVEAPRVISVNLSRAQLALGPQLRTRIVEILERFALPADCLQLEVTENEVMRDPVSARQLMIDLRRVGVRLAIDDFGTGASSLSCLRDYPFDVVKIDRSFVDELTTNQDMLAVLHATVTLVDNLRMACVAEGIENVSQVAILQSLGCGYAQGYFFSKPVPADRLLGSVPTQASIRDELDRLSAS